MTVSRKDGNTIVLEVTHFELGTITQALYNWTRCLQEKGEKCTFFSDLLECLAKSDAFNRMDTSK